jgi:hypothetical protein
MNELFLNLWGELEQNSDELSSAAENLIQGKTDVTACRNMILKIFYAVGLIGVRLEPKGAMVWSFRHQEQISETELKEDTAVAICPMFYRVLGAGASRPEV